MPSTKRGLICVVCALALSVTDCYRPIGPQSVARDRHLYAASLSDSWKEQTLLNIVKMRYLDPPAFVDVGNIVSSYTLTQGISATGNIIPNNQTPDATVGGFGTYSNTPTITYNPLTGSKFIRGLATPLPPEAVFLQHGGRDTGRRRPVYLGGVNQWLEKSTGHIRGSYACRSGSICCIQASTAMGCGAGRML